MSAAEMTVAGKVLDGSAVAALAGGNVGALSWLSVAWTVRLTFVVPAAARAEAALHRPDLGRSIARLLDVPVVIDQDDMADQDRHAIGRRQTRDGTFDPLASWVTGTARARGWSVLTSDPDRLRRLDPDVEVDAV